MPDLKQRDPPRPAALITLWGSPLFGTASASTGQVTKAGTGGGVAVSLPREGSEGETDEHAMLSERSKTVALATILNRRDLSCARRAVTDLHIVPGFLDTYRLSDHLPRIATRSIRTAEDTYEPDFLPSRPSLYPA